MPDAIGFPIWSPDGQRVAFQSNRDGDLALFCQRADGAGVAERLTRPEPGTVHIPQSWSPDGQTLLFSVSRGASFSLQTLSLAGGQLKPYSDVEGPSLVSAAFSPDGHWIAYSHHLGVFVEPFPATGAKYQIPQRTGTHPFWSPDGRGLYFSIVRGLSDHDC